MKYLAYVFLGLWCLSPASTMASEIECQSIEKKGIKVEGWVSKKFRKKKRAIAKEFTEMKHTRASIKVFPMGETAKVVAIGRCVPVHIARHVLEKALAYTGGVESLVNQAFLPTHWIGIGTTQFDEPSQQIISQSELAQLMAPELSTQEFHELYKKLSIQDDTVHYFGLNPKNVKKVH